MTQTEPKSAEDRFEAATAFQIDDADIAKDRAALGVWSACRDKALLSTATPEAIRNFAYSYGDDNPLYTDPAHGFGTRWGGQVAPAIMAAVLNAPLRGDRVPKELRGGSYRGIHAFVSGGTWEWFRPVYPGDTIYSYSGLESVEVKPSEFADRSVIRVIRDVKMNQHGEVVGVYRTLVINTERKTARQKGKYSAIEEPSYTKDDIAALDEIYAAEQVRGAEPRFFEDVAIGDGMGTMVKGPLTTTDMIVFHAGGYGFVPYGLKTGRMAYENRKRIAPFYIDNEYGVPDVAQRVHWDSEWAKAIGNPRAYDYGVLRECWIHHYLTDWMGDGAFVVRQHDEIRKFNYQADIQYLNGRVDGVRDDDGMTFVDVAVEVTNQRGETTALADATISLPSRQHGAALWPEAPGSCGVMRCGCSSGTGSCRRAAPMGEVDVFLTEERAELVRSVRGFLEKWSPESEVRRLMEAGGAVDPAVWSAMTDLGLQGLAVPEENGGGGVGYGELVLVLEAMGAALFVGPFLSTVVAASAFAATDDDELKAAYLPRLASGERIGALALAEDTGRWDADSVQTVAEPEDGGHRVTGVKSFVVDGQHADVFVVSARTAAGVHLFAVDADDAGVAVTPLRTLDATRPQARVEFSSARGRVLTGADLIDRVQAIAGVCLAAEQVGGAQRCLDMAVDYAKTRVQFGRPIGSFQAIKHKCADMLVAVESARSATYFAADVLDDGGDPALASTVAQAQCSAAYPAVAGENIQIHGGIGFTWDHPAHLYFRRAKSSEVLFGSPAVQLERLAVLVGI